MAISIAPERLKSQANQMENLISQYDALFGSVSSTLKSVNSNWSENLSNNFASKITSAQRGFSGILDTLQFGANAAKTSAEDFSDIDCQLSKLLSGVQSGSGKTTTTVSFSKD